MIPDSRTPIGRKSPTCIAASDPSLCPRLAALMSRTPQDMSAKSTTASTASHQRADFLVIHGAKSIPIRVENTIIAAAHRFVIMHSVGDASRRIGKQLMQRTGTPTFSFAFKAPSYSVNTHPHETISGTFVSLARTRAIAPADSGASDQAAWSSREDAPRRRHTRFRNDSQTACGKGCTADCVARHQTGIVWDVTWFHVAVDILNDNVYDDALPLHGLLRLFSRHKQLVLSLVFVPFAASLAVADAPHPQSEEPARPIVNHMNMPTSTHTAILLSISLLQGNEGWARRVGSAHRPMQSVR